MGRLARRLGWGKGSVRVVSDKQTRPGARLTPVWLDAGCPGCTSGAPLPARARARCKRAADYFVGVHWGPGLCAHNRHNTSFGCIGWAGMWACLFALPVLEPVRCALPGRSRWLERSQFPGAVKASEPRGCGPRGRGQEDACCQMGCHS